MGLQLGGGRVASGFAAWWLWRCLGGGDGRWGRLSWVAAGSALVLDEQHGPSLLLAGSKCANSVKWANLWVRLRSSTRTLCGTSPRAAPHGSGSRSRGGWGGRRDPASPLRAVSPIARLKRQRGRSPWKGFITVPGTHDRAVCLLTPSPGWGTPAALTDVPLTCCGWHQQGDAGKSRCLPRRAPAGETRSRFGF